MIVLRRLFQDRGAIVAIAIITIYVVLGVLAPLIT
ncbi:MAG: ABC transporter permease, partial [Staphylococcus epidermidis]|nr:ABC transporter permease [Staphylococcus epidermidis]